MSDGENVLALYWELASVNPATRQRAAESLITALHSFQLNHSASDIPKDASEESLEAACAEDVSYGLKRLLRGLPSSRAGARQGFAVALTELLNRLEFSRVSTVLEMLTKLTDTTGAKGQEEREIYFGRIFGLMAICESGMLARPHTTFDDVKQILSGLMKYATTKSYLKESCYKVILTLVEKLEGTEFRDEAVPHIISTVLHEGISSVDDLWFAIVLQAKEKDFDWATLLPTWKKGKVLHPKSVKQLAEFLKEATYTNPRLHSVWDALFDVILGDHRKKAVSLQDLWAALDETLFNSTHERKYLGIQLFQKLLPRVTPEEIPYIFSPELLRCLMNNLSKADNYLHEVAKQTAETLAKVALENSSVALQLVIQLVGKNGHHQFDTVTKTKVVEEILSSLSPEGIAAYVKHLSEIFLDQTDKDEEADPFESSTRRVLIHRQWAVDQMMLLVRTPKIPKDETWLKFVARFLALHAFFHVHDDVAEDELVKAPKPPLSYAARTMCQERFFIMLGYLQDLVLTKGAEKGEKLPAGTLPSGQFWVSDIHSFVVSAKKDKRLSLVSPLDDEAVTAVKKGAAILDRISKEIAKKEDKIIIAQYKAFELLFLHILLQVYSDPGEAVGLLEDLEKCYDKFFIVKKPSPKKRKADADEDDEGDFAPIDVLIDILISFLAKPSALLRALSHEVFKAFCSQMTKKALDIILEVLRTKAGFAGAKELFEPEDEDVEMEDAEESEDAEDAEGEADAADSTVATAGDDEESDEDEDEDEDIEEDDAAEPVDEELKLKLLAALGKAAAPADDEDDEDESDEEFLDDDQMGAFDEKLAEIFKERKNMKAVKKDTKQQVLHFQFRLVDMLETFLQKSPTSPLTTEMAVPVLKLIIQSGAADKELQSRLSGFVRNRLTRPKEIPRLEGADADRAYAILEEVHELARSSINVDFSNICSAVSMWLVKCLAHAQPEAPAGEETDDGAKGKKKKKSVDGKVLRTRPPPPPLTRVASIYASTLTDFMTKNKSKVRPSLFLDIVNRHPDLAWELLPSMVDLLSPTVNAKSFPLVQLIEIIAKLIKQTPDKQSEARIGVMRQVLPKFSAHLGAILSGAV
ncbi:DNA polymerase phi-domain-containing protein, partial [Blyttiomyces helicus]